MERAVHAIVLCGGSSRRMRQPKEWLEVAGQALLTRTAEVVSSVAPRIVIAAGPDQRLPPLPDHCAIVVDDPPGQGPLAGIASGLTAVPAAADGVLVVACDYPLLQPAFLRRLIELFDGRHAVVPYDGDHPHPLLAVYPRAIDHVVASLLQSGERRARALLRHLPTLRATPETLALPDELMNSLLNANTPDELDRIRLLIEPGPTPGEP